MRACFSKSLTLKISPYLNAPQTTQNLVCLGTPAEYTFCKFIHYTHSIIFTAALILSPRHEMSHCGVQCSVFGLEWVLFWFWLKLLQAETQNTTVAVFLIYVHKNILYIHINYFFSENVDNKPCRGQGKNSK